MQFQLLKGFLLSFRLVNLLLKLNLLPEVLLLEFAKLPNSHYLGLVPSECLTHGQLILVASRGFLIVISFVDALLCSAWRQVCRAIPQEKV